MISHDTHYIRPQYAEELHRFRVGLVWTVDLNEETNFSGEGWTGSKKPWQKDNDESKVLAPYSFITTRAAGANLSESARASWRKLRHGMINHGIMLNVSTENFTHNRILRADNTFLTSKDYEFVNFLSRIASNVP